jgi:hypothetical protein
VAVLCFLDHSFFDPLHVKCPTEPMWSMGRHWWHSIAPNANIGRLSVILVLLIASSSVISLAFAFDGHPREERDRSDTSSAPRDPWRAHKNGMATNGDYPNLLAPDNDGQIVRPIDTKHVPVEVPTVQLADILPSTGFVVVRDMLTQTILANSTGFFVSPNVFLTAAHTVAPLIRRFHVQLDIISNSRSIDAIRTYHVTGLSYDFESTPCQILLQVRRVTTLNLDSMEASALPFTHQSE